MIKLPKNPLLKTNKGEHRFEMNIKTRTGNHQQTFPQGPPFLHFFPLPPQDFRQKKPFRKTTCFDKVCTPEKKQGFRSRKSTQKKRPKKHVLNDRPDFLEAASLKPLPSQAFLARARNRGRAIGIASEALLIDRKLGPSAEFGLVDLRKLVVFAIFKSLVRPSAEFRVVESLSLRRGAHFDEAARPKPLPSQWDLHARKLAASSQPSPSHWDCF